MKQKIVCNQQDYIKIEVIEGTRRFRVIISGFPAGFPVSGFPGFGLLTLLATSIPAGSVIPPVPKKTIRDCPCSVPYGTGTGTGPTRDYRTSNLTLNGTILTLNGTILALNGTIFIILFFVTINN